MVAVAVAVVLPGREVKGKTEAGVSRGSEEPEVQEEGVAVREVLWQPVVKKEIH